MKQNKIVIVVLVVIALVFILGLSAGVFRDKNDKSDELTMSNARNQKTGWMAWLDGAMEPFRRSLDNRRLAQRAICQTGNRAYQLTDEKACDIPISASIDGVEVESADIIIEGQKVNVELAYYSDKKDSESTTGMGKSFNTVKMAKNVGNIGVLIPPKLKPGSIQSPLELTVGYYPKGKENQEPNKKMGVERDVRLTVLEKGGLLRLTCNGCNGQQKRVINVILK